MSAGVQPVEAPSGKGADDENFPVGSWLLPAKLRPHVARFYAFARAIDDIADNPELAADDKVARLDLMEAVLTGAVQETGGGLEKAHAIRESLDETGIATQHCRDLVSAFRQDAVKTRYATWDELIDYCNRSAAPVGRYLLDLHGEDKRDYVWSDALCNALQVINHMQDCADDYAALDRVYLPQSWLAQEGTQTEALAEPTLTPGLRAVVDRCLDGCRDLMADAVRLPGALSHRRLALESAVIVKLAQRLIHEIATRDPIAERVELTRMQSLRCAGSGIVWVLSGARPRTRTGNQG